MRRVPGMFFAFALGSCGGDPAPARIAQAVVGPPAVVFRYPGFRPGDLSTAGSAQILAGGALRLTPANGAVNTGAAWMPVAVPVLGGLQLEATIRIHGAGGLAGGGDGMALVIQRHGPGAIGAAGCGLGYAGLPHSVAVELDTYLNVDECGQPGDPDGNHISVHANQADPSQGTSADEGASLASAPAPFDLKAGGVHVLAVQVDDGELRVSLDGVSLIATAYDVSDIADADGQVWIGFTAATVSAWANHDLLDLEVHAWEPSACPWACGDPDAPDPLDQSYCATGGLLCSCAGRAAGDPPLPIACAAEDGFCRGECGYDLSADELACLSIGQVGQDCVTGEGGSGGGGGGDGGDDSDGGDGGDGEGDGGDGGGGGSGGGGGDSPVPCPCDGFVDAAGNPIDTDVCGRVACGGDGDLWMCTLDGWRDLGAPCAGPAGEICSCDAATMGGRSWVTRTCGRVACDLDGEEWVCTPDGFTEIGRRCRQEWSPIIPCTEGAIAPEPPGGPGSPLPPALEAVVRQLVASALQSGNPLLIQIAVDLVDSLWQIKLATDRAAARAGAADPAGFDRFADLGWHFVGSAWTGARVDRAIGALARFEAAYGTERVDVRGSPWHLVHGGELPDDAVSEVLAHTFDFMGLPRTIARIRVELDSRAVPASEAQQVDLVVHALHHAVVARLPMSGAEAADFRAVWLEAIWPLGDAIERALMVSRFALLSADEDLAESGVSFVAALLRRPPGKGKGKLAGQRNVLYRLLADDCNCLLASGEGLNPGEEFCTLALDASGQPILDESSNPIKERVRCTREPGDCQLERVRTDCGTPIFEQCFCEQFDGADLHGYCDQTICRGGADQGETLSCVNREWQPAEPVECTGCPPGVDCRPVVADPDRPTLQWVNRRRCLHPCQFEPGDLVTTEHGPLRHQAALAYRGLRAAYRAHHANAGKSLSFNNGYRPFSEQLRLFRRSRAAPRSCVETMTALALPGHSEHQTGDAIDFNAWNIDWRDPHVKDTDAAAFIETYACLWGFVRSYPDGGMAITGYAPEPWHWRFVGRHRAALLRLQPDGTCAVSGTTLEEYLIEHPDEVETSDCSDCDADLGDLTEPCVETISPVPLPPPLSTPPDCPDCPATQPPAPDPAVTLVSCPGDGVSIPTFFAADPESGDALGPNSLTIPRDGIVRIQNDGGAHVISARPDQFSPIGPGLTCLQFTEAGAYGLFEDEGGDTAIVHVL